MTTRLCSKCDLNFGTKTSPWCRSCLNTLQRDFVKRCKDSGLCQECAKLPNLPNRTKCAICTEKRLKTQAVVRAANKANAVAFLGGKCVDCGLETNHYEVYDFDHIDRTQKIVEVSTLMQRHKWEDILVELEKCELRCSNCHRIKHVSEGWPSRWHTS